MPDATIPEQFQPPPPVVLPPPMDGAHVLASVDKPAAKSKSHKLALYSLAASMSIAGLVAISMGIALIKGQAVDWSDAAVFVAAIAAAASPAAAAAASQRASDSKVRAKALERG